MEISVYTWNKSKYIEEELKRLKSEYKDIKVNYYLKGEEKNYRNSKYILGVDMSEEELGSCEKLKKIFVPYTGLNGFPQEELKKRKIEIEGSHVKAKYVAEKGFSLLLGIMGKVTEYDKGMREGIWGPRSGIKNHWESVFNKRIGLIGMGHIAKEFMKITKPFNPTFITQDRGKKYEGIDKYLNSLEEVAKESDILFVSLPLNPSTEGLVDRRVLDNFSGYLINVGRGKTIAEKDLYEVLKEGKVKGAGIDVWYNYPKSKEAGVYPSKYPFHELDNLIMSPHVATSNIEDRWIYFEDAFEKLRKKLAEHKIK